MAWQGQFAEALRDAETIRDMGSQVVAFCYIAKAQFRAGLVRDAAATFDRALKAAQSNSKFRELWLSHIAVAHAKLGNFSDARKVTQLISEDSRPGDLIAELEARAFVTAGKPQDALRAVHSIKYDHEKRATLLAAIIEVLPN